MPETIKKETFNKQKHLTEQQKKDFDYVISRIEQLKETKKDVYGINLEKLFAEADKNYVPHRLKTTGRKMLVSDDEKGWRSSLQEVGTKMSWRSDVSESNPYVKIQIALGLLIDRNPEGVFSPGASKYENSNLLMKHLYQRSWEIAKSKQQLKLFIYNLAKYGWGISRTYPLKLTSQVKKIKEYNEENPEDSIWEEKEVTDFNGIIRENLDPNNAWIDDMAKPSNPFSIRDWSWRKPYSMDNFKSEFGNYKRAKYVQPGGITDEKITGQGESQKKFQEKDLVEVYFYESKVKDLFMVIANSVPVVIEPLPVESSSGAKRLSCWQTYWTLRHAESPYGIGLYEAMRYDQGLLDRIRNMTIDQLTLAIYKMFFHSGTTGLTETGTIDIEPGKGKQMLEPKNIQWLEVPGPGKEAWAGIEMFKKAIDEVTGITPPLGGEILGKTAFETLQAKEAALKRLKTPLDNVSEALEEEGYITVSLIQLTYSLPEIIKITDQDKIDRYLQEIGSDSQLFERRPNEETGEEDFYAKIYPEIQLGLEEDEGGNLIESEKTRFFRVKPKSLEWEGILKIKPQSILTPSPQLDRVLVLEMLNILIPLLAQPPQLYGKIVKNILKEYEKNPEDWLTDEYLGTIEQKPQEAPLFIPQGQAVAPGAEKLVGTPIEQPQLQGMGGKVINKFSSTLRGMGG